MRFSGRIDILQSPLFIISLVTLLLNDWFLKYQFHNWLTGKLSDVTGLVVCFLLAYAFFPRHARTVIIVLAASFTYWKSSYSQGLIDSWNQLGFMLVNRTIDYTDLLAVAVLPMTWRYAERQCKKEARLPFSYLLIFVSMFAITGTSKVHHTPEELLLMKKIDKVHDERVSDYVFSRDEIDPVMMNRLETLIFTLPDPGKLEPQGVKASSYRKDWFEAINYNFGGFYINTWVFHGLPGKLTEYYISPVKQCDRQLALGLDDEATAFLGAYMEFYRTAGKVYIESLEITLCDIPVRKDKKEAINDFMESYIKEIETRFYSVGTQ